jgi:hypothetical protein
MRWAAKFDKQTIMHVTVEIAITLIEGFERYRLLTSIIISVYDTRRCTDESGVGPLLLLRPAYCRDEHRPMPSNS